MVVPPVAAPVPVPHDAWETESDRIITERLRTVFRQDYEVAPVQADVAISTVQHVVTLTGRVATERQHAVMVGHARATAEVTTVDDRIVLSP